MPELRLGLGQQMQQAVGLSRLRVSPDAQYTDIGTHLKGAETTLCSTPYPDGRSKEPEQATTALLGVAVAERTW
jgi:hypothetical protein